MKDAWERYRARQKHSRDRAAELVNRRSTREQTAQDARDQAFADRIAAAIYDREKNDDDAA